MPGNSAFNNRGKKIFIQDKILRKNSPQFLEKIPKLVNKYRISTFSDLRFCNITAKALPKRPRSVKRRMNCRMIN